MSLYLDFREDLPALPEILLFPVFTRIGSVTNFLIFGNPVKKLPALMLSAGDDLILEGFTQVTEVIGITSDAHDEVAVLFGM